MQMQSMVENYNVIIFFKKRYGIDFLHYKPNKFDMY